MDALLMRHAKKSDFPVAILVTVSAVRVAESLSRVFGIKSGGLRLGCQGMHGTSL